MRTKDLSKVRIFFIYSLNNKQAMELTNDIKNQLETQEQYEIFNDDKTQSFIVRTPTFEEFEIAFTDAFEFKNREFDLSTFTEKLIPICFISGDKLFEDEENMYFISEKLEPIFLQTHFIEIPQVIETIDGVDYIRFDYEDKKAYCRFPDFKTVRYVKNEILKKNKMIPICKQIFLSNLDKNKTSDEFILNPKVLLISAMSIMSYVKTKEFTIKKK